MLDQMMAGIRDELRRRQAGGAAPAAPPPDRSGLSGTHEGPSWAPFDRHAQTAAEYAPVSSLEPQFKEWSGVRRKVALRTARAVQFLARFITNKQAIFNEAILGAVRELARHLQAMPEHRFELARAVESQGLELQRLKLEVQALRRSMDQAPASPGEGKAPVQWAARLDSLADRISALEEELLPASRTDGTMAEKLHQLDVLYRDFEAQFRGTRADIKARARVYLERLTKAGIGSAEMPVLDLGCGRGEWLELLQDHGLHARGVDLNPIFVEENRQRGLAVSEGEGLQALRALPDASLGAVTAFHVIEHLPFDHWLAIIDEAVRVLKPGGAAIFETPNPANLLVASSRFYLDPTHRNPLPSPLVRFIAEARGLTSVEVVELHPAPLAFSGMDPVLSAQLNHHFSSGQDYAVIGWRPRPA
jgi:SAM-dependent methyltransferase